MLADMIEKGYFTCKLYNRELPLFYYLETDSTNEEAKRYHAEHKNAQALFIADAQTKGKGRRGRQFYSPAKDGIYMSLLFIPKEELSDVIAVTTAASVIAAQAIEEVTGQMAAIKWVNDVYVRERKVCGILAEAILPDEPGGCTAVILGIGINVYNRDFPEELEGIAGSLGEGSGNPEWKDRLIIRITEGLVDYLSNVANRSFMEEYRKRSMVLDKNITCYDGRDIYPAHAIDIEEDGGLVIITDAGERRTLHSGEITIRLKE